MDELQCPDCLHWQITDTLDDWQCLECGSRHRATHIPVSSLTPEAWAELFGK